MTFCHLRGSGQKVRPTPAEKYDPYCSYLLFFLY